MRSCQSAIEASEYQLAASEIYRILDPPEILEGINGILGDHRMQEACRTARPHKAARPATIDAPFGWYVTTKYDRLIATPRFDVRILDRS